MNYDLPSTHEEADVILVQHAIYEANKSEQARISIVSDDTDVFVLLLHFYQHQNLTCPMIMAPAVHGRDTLDIKSTVRKHKDIIPSIVQMHALTGCDTVAQTYNIGKITAVSVLQKGTSLTKLGNVEEPFDKMWLRSSITLQEW